MEKEINFIEIDPRDNKSLYINGVRVVGVSAFKVEIGQDVIISFPANVSVKQ